jgi:hypothetical protein
MAKDDGMGLLGSDLTPEEQKFLDSRGESGLPDPPPETETPAAPAPAVPPATAVESPVPPPGAPPAPAAAGAEEEDDDDAPGAVDPKTGKQPPRRVPFRKFKVLEDNLTHANQELAQQRARSQELQETLARADERMRIINEALASDGSTEQEEEVDDPRPDPREDVFAYMEWQERQTARLFGRASEQISGLSNRHEDFTQQTQQTQDIQRMENQFRADAQLYSRTQPHFAQAYAHLMGLRNRQYEALGLTDPAARNERILNEEREIVSSAYQNRQNPAEQMYRLAIVSGYNPEAPIPGTPAAAAPATAAPPPAVPPSPAAPTVAEVLASVRRGQGAAETLSAGGGVPPSQLTPELLGQMSDEDFGRLMDRLPRSKIRELLPGA